MWTREAISANTERRCRRWPQNCSAYPGSMVILLKMKYPLLGSKTRVYQERNYTFLREKLIGIFFLEL